MAEIGAWIVHKILKEIKLNVDELWGLSKHRFWKITTIMITIYRDLFGLSFDKLLQQIHLIYKVSKKTLERNIHKCRYQLKEWASSVLKIVSSNRLKKHGQLFNSQFFVGKVTLWADSTEFRIKGKSKTSRFSTTWSHKLNGPGRKFLTIHDGHMRTIFCFWTFSGR